MLLTAFAPAASAANYDMRGEWSMEFKSAGAPPGIASGVIRQMNLVTGEFSATLQKSTGGSIVLEGTMSGTTGSMTATTDAPFGVVTFVTSSLAIETAKNSLSASGEFYLNGKEFEPGTLTGTRTKTYQEVVEREEREQREAEEAAARQAIRGEWAVTLESGPQVAKGIALVKEAANLKNEFESSSALFESVVPGSFAGTLKGKEASVTVAAEAYGPYPESRFESTEITVGSGTSSMSGPGTLTVGAAKAPATLTATRLRTYRQIEEQEQREKEAKEAEEREAREAKERAEREAREKAEREAREKAEREAVQSALTPPITSGGTTNTPSPPVSVQLAAKAFTAGSALSLRLTNPNDFAVQGRVTLSLASGKAAASKAGKTKPTALGTASFSISPHGTALLKIALSRSGRAELAHRHTLHVIASITTTASGQPSAGRSYRITLHAPSAHHHG
jgi:hypothetical protein